MISAPVRFRTFAGRQSELDHLHERRRAAAAGRGGAVLIAGDPGIGKSRLVREFRERLPRRTTRVATAAYREFAQRPLAPLVGILEQLDASAAARLAASRGASKSGFLAAFVEAFEAISAAGTTLAILEDVHWADRESLEIVCALLPSAATRRLLFIVTYRDSEVTASHPNFSLIARLLRDPAASLVALPPLGDTDMASLLRDAVATRAAISPTIIERIRLRSDGNALFAEELLRYAIAQAADDGADDGNLPISLHAALLERLERASDQARRFLSAASLFGRRFDIALTEQIVPTKHADVGPVLHELEALGIIECENKSSYRFRHALLRDIVYAAIPSSDRRSLHDVIAHTIVKSSDADEQAETLAHHFWHAGERASAAPYFKRAGERARSVHAYEDAASWFERAADCYESDADIASALSAAAQVWGYADRVDRALELYRRASDLYVRGERIDDALSTSVLTASLMFESGRASAAITTLEALRRQRLASASVGVRHRFLIRMGFMYAACRHIARAWECLEAIDDTQLDDQPLLAAEWWFLKSGLHAQCSEADDWHRSFERGFTLFEHAGAMPDNLRVALSNAAAQGFNIAQSDIAVAYQERAVAMASKIKANADHERLLLAQMHLVAGNIATAQKLYVATARADRFATRVERAIVEAALARLLGDDDLAANVDRGLLAHARAAGNRAAIARLACAFAPLDVALGLRDEVTEMLELATGAIDTTFGLAQAIATIAAYRPSTVAPLRDMIARAAERPENRLDRALLAFVDAALAEDPTERAAIARSAAAQFGALHWAWLRSQALEIAGDDTAAMRLYREWGASGEVRRLERLCLTRPANRRSDGILTRRERELLRLVATGEANRSAAQQLSISEKAVEKHLTSIYGKLGLTSRAQLVAYVAGPKRALDERVR